MRIRTYPAVAFGALVLAAAYLGLASSTIPTYKQSDKALHFLTFALLTLCFYWIVEQNKRRNLQLTVLVCTLGLGVGSEVVQALLPNGRDFDVFDIVANLLGSGSALGLCLWYHKRMLERKRSARSFDMVPGEGVDDVDLELGNDGLQDQENGVIRQQTIEQEVDNWDEHADDDWAEMDDAAAAGDAAPAKQAEPDVTVVKRND